jgi:long-chain acyl-CoA synthetase
MGDELGLKGMLVNYVVRKVKKLVPRSSCPAPCASRRRGQGRAAALCRWRWGRRHRRAAVHRRHHRRQQGAVLLHRNIIANVLQSEAWNNPVLQDIRKTGEQVTSICALPLYHIFAFTVNMMLAMRTGGATS